MMIAIVENPLTGEFPSTEVGGNWVHFQVYADNGSRENIRLLDAGFMLVADPF